MELYSENKNYKLYNGNMLDMLEVIEKESIDSIVTDPPYELNFMNKGWDNSGIAFNLDTWKQCYEVLKPGGYLLAFGGSRTYHRIACAIEDAGFEIRDTIMWLYGSGFPKSMNISKGIEAKEKLGNAGTRNKRKIEQNCDTESYTIKQTNNGAMGEIIETTRKEYIPSTELSKQWNGWGTCLKPSFEPIIVARKPFKGSCVDNVIKYGVGGINIDECRVGNEKIINKGMSSLGVMHDDNWISNKNVESIVNGRFPANTILTYDETDFDEVCGGFPINKSTLGPAYYKGNYTKNGWKNTSKQNTSEVIYNDSGSASRYFYCAKANKKDRDEGIKEYYQIILNKEDYKCEENMELVQLLQKVISGLEVENLNILEYGKNIMVIFPKECKSTILTEINKITELKTWNLLIQSLTKDYIVGASCETMNGGNLAENVENLKELKQTITNENQELVLGVSNVAYQMLLKIKEEENWKVANNFHCTVKPTELMQYLVRLVTPNSGIVLDPFNGSGSTGKAVMYENKERNKNYKYIGIELTEEYLPIAKARIEYVCNLETKEEEKQLTIFDYIGDSNE